MMLVESESQGCQQGLEGKKEAPAGVWSGPKRLGRRPGGRQGSGGRQGAGDLGEGEPEKLEGARAKGGPGSGARPGGQGGPQGLVATQKGPPGLGPWEATWGLGF